MMVEIKTADEVFAGQNTGAFDNACQRVMADIERASAKGCCEAVFVPYGHIDYESVYNAVKERFTKAGYRFRMYGCSGGVRQDTEMICWGE